MNSSPGVQLRAVTKRFGERLVLNEISLKIEPSETVALIGPSGGGKSTLLRCVNGLNRFDSGEIAIGTHTLPPQATLEQVAAVRRSFGMVFQDFQLFPHFSVLRNVMEAPRLVLRQPEEVVRERAIKLLDRMGLGNRLDAYPRQLSGGQKQRVAIARALAMEPRGLLCDEITSALDPELKGEILSVIADLKQEGLTILMVTHEIHFARRIADRVVVLADGGILEEGSAAAVLEAPREPRTRKFLQNVLE